MNKEKKKLLVVGVLALAVVGVGAFQFMGHKPKVVAKSDKDPSKAMLVADAAVKDPEADLKRYIVPLMSPADSPRDPFTPQAVIIDEPTTQDNHALIPAPGSIGGNREINVNGQGPKGPINPNFSQIDPNGLSLSPINSGPVLRGVIIGKQNMAIIENANKEQVLVWEGKMFGNWTVVAISDTEVVLNNQGKVMKLALAGGN